MKEYLSTQEVADRLGVSVFTIRRYIRAGKLRAVKLDGAYRLSRDELQKFLRSREIVGFAARAALEAPTPPPRRGLDNESTSIESSANPDSAASN